MNALALRKQLLMAESDLNRVQLVQEWQTMTGEVHALADQARTIGSLTSAAALLVAGLASIRSKKNTSADEKPSWLQTIFKGAGLISTFWQSLRSPDRGQPDK